MDAAIRTFLARHPDAVVVNLGGGLDTRFFRVDNGRVLWKEIDVPESIALSNLSSRAESNSQFSVKVVPHCAECL